MSKVDLLLLIKQNPGWTASQLHRAADGRCSFAAMTMVLFELEDLNLVRHIRQPKDSRKTWWIVQKDSSQ